MGPLNKAGRLQRGVRDDEERQRNMVDYDDQHVRQATVHAREDLVLVVSYLLSISRQLAVVIVLLAVIAAVLVAQWLL